MPKKVNMVPPQGGQPVGIDESKVALYEKLGYSREATSQLAPRLQEKALSEQYDTLGHGAKAVGEGVLSGFSLGFSDLGNRSRASEMRERYHPGKRLVGEIAGIVGPSLLAPTAGAGRIFSLTPAGAAALAGEAGGSLLRGGLRRVAVRGAIEGAAQGVGQVVSSHGLHDTPLTAEELLAGAGIGSVLGAGAEALGMGLVKGGKALYRSGTKVVGSEAKAASSLVSDVDYNELRSLVGTFKGEAKAAKKEAEELLVAVKQFNKEASAARFADIDLPSGATGGAGATPVKAASKAVKPASKGTVDIGPMIRGVKAHADELFGLASLDPAISKEAAREISTIRKVYTKFDETLKSGNVEKGLKYYDEYYDAVGSLARKMGEPMIPKAKVSSAVGTVNEALKAVPEISQKLGKEFDKVGGSGQFPPEVIKGIEERLKTIQAVLETSDLLPSLPKTKDGFFAMSKAERVKLVDALERATGLESFSSTATHIKDKLATITQKTGVVSDGSVAQAFGKSVDTLVEGGKKSSKRSIWGEAAARQAGSFIGNLLPGPLKTAGRYLGYAAAKNAGGFAAGYLASGGDVKAGVVTAVALQSGVRARIKRGIGLLAMNTGKVSTMAAPAMARVLDSVSVSEHEKASKSLTEAAMRFSEEVNDLAQGRAASLAFVGLDEVREHSPELAGRMGQKIAEAYLYLQKNTPQDPGTVMIGGKSMWKMSEQQARQTAEMAYGVLKPMEAYEAFIKGEISPYAMRSFRDVWPELHAQAVGELMLQLPELLKGANMQRRSHLSELLGTPVSSLNDPKIAKGFQESILNAPNKGVEQQQQNSAGMPSPTKPGGSAASAQLQTAAQRTLSR